MLVPCRADSLDSLASLSLQFGPVLGSAPAGIDAATGYSFTETKFRYDGLNIFVISENVGSNPQVTKVKISRDSTFNSLEIPDILKMLSSSGDWTQKDDSTWTLSNSKIAAHWDGESKIFVYSEEPTAQTPSVPRGTGSYGK
jgi:hypothetical protein